MCLAARSINLELEKPALSRRAIIAALTAVDPLLSPRALNAPVTAGVRAQAMTMAILSLTMADAYATINKMRELYAALSEAAHDLRILDLDAEAARLSEAIIDASNSDEDLPVAIRLLHLTELSLYYLSVGRHADAFTTSTAFADIVNTYRRMYGSRSEQKAASLSLQGHVLFTIGRRQEGADMIVASMQLFLELGLGDTPEYTDTLMRVIPVASLLPGGALNYARTATRNIERHLARDSLPYAKLMYSLAKSLLEARYYREAAEAANKAIAAFQTSLGRSIAMARAFRILGKAQMELGQVADSALTLLTSATMLTEYASSEVVAAEIAMLRSNIVAE